VRILLVTPYLHPEGGGLERYAAMVGTTLAASGHEVTLVGHTSEPMDEERGHVRCIGLPPALRISNTPLRPRMHRELRRLLRAEHFDVVNAHTPVPGAAEMAWWAARREGTPFVVTYHAGELRSGSSLFAVPARFHRHTMERAMIVNADARIAVSDFVARRVFHGLKSTLASPGVDTERFTPGGTPVPGRILYVGPVARAYAWKGLSFLTEAITLLRARFPTAHLRAVGDGDLAERYRACGVVVTGRVDDARLVDEYRAASVVALPSVTDAESFGMVLAEANACGRPVVGSRVGGIPCFVRDGDNGLLAEPGDAASLAERLARILSDPELARALGARGRARVELEHSWAGVSQRCLGVFTEVCARAGRSTGP